MLRREQKKKQVLHDIKDIFLDSLSLPKPHEAKPIIEKLFDMVDKIRDEDLDSNVKLLEWSEWKFHSKILENISSVIALR